MSASLIVVISVLLCVQLTIPSSPKMFFSFKKATEAWFLATTTCHLFEAWECTQFSQQPTHDHLHN